MQDTRSVVRIVALAQLLIRRCGLKPVESPAAPGGGRRAMCTLLRGRRRCLRSMREGALAARARRYGQAHGQAMARIHTYVRMYKHVQIRMIHKYIHRPRTR